MPRHKSRAREALDSVLFIALVALLCAVIPFDANARDGPAVAQVSAS